MASFSVVSNVLAVNARANLNTTNIGLQKVLERLSSGYRINHTATAIDAMARKDILTRRDAVSKSLAIVSELQSTLNMEQGGDIAVQLDRLYSWMTDSLVEATVKQDPGPIHDVRKVLENLCDAWQQIAAAKPVPESAA